jgi:hypothetical protein
MDTHVSSLPGGDAICIERLPGRGQRIYRLSGRPIGELIPIGVDPSHGLLELMTVEGTFAPFDAIPASAETFDDKQYIKQIKTSLRSNQI